VAPYDPADRMEESLNSVVPPARTSPTTCTSSSTRSSTGTASWRSTPATPERGRRLRPLDGHAVGIVANQPAHMAGALDIDAATDLAVHPICDRHSIR